MRPLWALVITILMIGGVFSYIRFADSVRRPPMVINVDYAKGEYLIEIECTFACEAEPIFGAEPLKVLFKGSHVFASDVPIPAGESIVVGPLEGVETGENEIHVSANMPESNRGLGVVKVTVKRNDISIAEKLISSEPGLTTVGGPVVFTVREQAEKEIHPH